jgi:hypothetical protein
MSRSPRSRIGITLWMLPRRSGDEHMFALPRYLEKAFLKTVVMGMTTRLTSAGAVSITIIANLAATASSRKSKVGIPQAAHVPPGGESNNCAVCSARDLKSYLCITITTA